MSESGAMLAAMRKPRRPSPPRDPEPTSDHELDAIERAVLKALAMVLVRQIGDDLMPYGRGPRTRRYADE
jgi:hypothetical protein